MLRIPSSARGSPQSAGDIDADAQLTMINEWARSMLVPALLLLSVIDAKAKGPWVHMRDPVSRTTITLVGTTHAPTYVPFATHEALRVAIQRSEAVYFETVDGFLAPTRRVTYESSTTRFVREADLAGAAKVCAFALKLATPKNFRATLEAAPVVLRAFMMGKKPSSRTLSTPLPNTLDVSDAALLAEARSSRRNVLEAESTDDVIDFAAGFSLGDTTAAIESVCRAMQEPQIQAAFDAQFAEIDPLLASGDWDDLYLAQRRFHLEVLKLPEPAFERLIDYRNERMLKRVLSNETGVRAIALIVGATHMGGPHGLITLLKQRGFTVTAE